MGMGFERELVELERAIARLNAEYGAFLYGAAGKAPLESRRQVEAMLRRLGTVEIDDAAERYKLATLQGHFSTQSERWERQQAEKEDGRRPGFYSAFSGTAARPTATVRPHPNETKAASVQSGGTAVSAAPAVADGQGRDLFERYLGAKRALGEDVSAYKYGDFVDNLERERRRIKERIGTDDFDLDVKDSDGRVRLVARRRKPAGEQ